ncbi:hypothetical protein ACX801_10240 [Arthrobacter bambusae]
MITTIELDRYFHITGLSRSEIEESINTAVETARVHAMREGWQGIVVTRHEPGLYTVNLSGDVPYGVTMERDLCRSTGAFPYRGTETAIPPAN